MEVKPGYKQTEMGVIPADWDVVTLGAIATIRDGTHQTPRYVPVGIPFYSVEHVTGRDFSNTKFISEEEHRFLTRSFKIEKGDVLMTRIGSIGDCVLVDWDVEASFYVSLALLKIHGAYAPYVAAYSELPIFKKEVDLHSLPSATPKKINLGLISNVRLALPSDPEEQKVIAGTLRDVDALLDKLNRLIAKKRDLRDGTKQELLAGRIRLPGFGKKDFSYRQTEVGAIPEDWRVVALGKVCNFENGDRSSNYPSPSSFVESGIPFINAGHVADGKIDSAAMDYITPESYRRLGGGKVVSGDILFCLRGSLGKFGVVNDDFGEGAIASSLVIVRPKSTSLTREFLTYYFSSSLCRRMIDRWAGGAAQPNLGVQDLAQFLIAQPSTTSEEHAITDVLSDMDAELYALEARRDKTYDLKQAMMQELLTGKTRLVPAGAAHA
jgi:type I restriction enzyme S subunit